MTWQYKVADLDQLRVGEEELLNSLGRQGWELVAVTEIYAMTSGASGISEPEVVAGTTAYFKSPKE